MSVELNLEGVVVGAASLLVIGAFHPLVIWCEYRFTRRAWPVFLIVGLLCLLAALLIQGFLSILLGLLAACLEEHFPHSMANAVVEECPALTRVSLKPSSAQENSLLKVVSSP